MHKYYFADQNENLNVEDCIIIMKVSAKETHCMLGPFYDNKLRLIQALAYARRTYHIIILVHNNQFTTYTSDG